MYDSYGDGFADASIIFSGPDDYSYAFQGISGSQGEESICDMSQNGCYGIEITNCNWSEEASYSLGR
jgi:hypothetical protein